MAINMRIPDFFQEVLPVPTGTSSGDPLVVNGIPCVALEDEGNITTGYATCRMIGGADLSVAAVDDSGNTTIKFGDTIYYDAAQTPVLSRRASGVPYGKAYEAISTVGATATIIVVLGQWADADGLTGKGTFCEFDANPVTSAVGGGAASGTAVNVMSINGINFEYDPLGTQTITAPSLAATGLNVGMDQTDNDGVIISRGITAMNPESFTIGDGAFYAKCRFTIPVVLGTDDCGFGFVKGTAYPANIDDFTDAALLNAISGDIYTETILNNAATTSTDTTDNWADAEEHEFEIQVSSAGVVTFLIDGAAPTVTQAFTFDTGDRVYPAFFLIHANAAQAGAVTISKWESGLQ